MAITDTIKQYYENILQRPASDDEANFWAEKVDAGEYDLEQVRDAFINSPEGQHVQDIVRLYQGSFNRVPDAGGLKSWVQSGRPLDEIAEGFTNSDEFHKLYETKDPSEAFITSLYRNVLGREPDSEGLSNWMNSGLSAHQILIGFTESVEFRGDAGAWVGKFLDRAGEGKSVFEGTLYNDAPVAGDPVALPSMEEDGGSVTFSAADLLVNVKDYDADDVSVKSVTVDPAAGELVDNGNGTWTFTPAADSNGNVAFEVVVTDGELDTTTSATLEVTPVNDAPVAGEPVVLDAMEEDGTITITAEQLLKNVVDVDGDELSLVVTADSGDLVDNGDGTWTFTPAADFNGTVNFSVTVSDASGEWDETPASLEVTLVNDVPAITNAETSRIGEEMFGISGFGIMSIDPLAVTKTASVSDAEGNFAGGSVRIDVSGKIGDHTLTDGAISPEYIGIFPAGKENDDVAAGKFYSVGSNLVMRAGVAGNDIDMVIGTYKAGFVDGQVQGQTGFGIHDAGEATFATVTLNANASAEIVTELLKNIRLGNVDSDEGDLNVKVTVTDGDGLSADFTRLLDVDGRAQMTKEDEDPYESIEEVELLDRVNHSLAIEEIDFDSNGSVMNGATITVTGDNWTDKLRLNATDASIQNGQARFILNVNGTYDVSVKVEGTEIVIGTTTSLPKAGDQLVVTLNENATDDELVEVLLNSLTVDMSSDLGERTFTVVYDSAKGPNDLVDTDHVEIQMTRTVVGDFKQVTMDQLVAATALNPVIIDSNTRIILSDATLDIEQAIEDGKIVVSGEGHLIRLISTSDADISGVTGLDKLGTYSFHEIDADLTISAEQANNSKGNVTDGHTLTVTGIENLPGLDLSKLDDGEGDIVAELNAATNVTFSGDLGDASMIVTGPGTLTVSADHSSGKTINFAGGTIVITGFGTSPYDLSMVSVGGGHVKTDVTADLEMNKDAKLGVLELAITQNATLTLTAAQANGRMITGGDVDGNGKKGASVIVTDLIDGTDLRDIEPSEILVGATNATKSDLIVRVTGEEGAVVDGVLEVTGLNLGSFIVQIDEGATLKTDSNSIDGANIQGAGSIIVTADGDDIDVDLSKIVVTGEKTLEVSADGSDEPSLDADAVIGDFKVVVANNATFSLTAVQADGKTITGADAIAEDLDAEIAAADGGSITVALSGGAAYDLSNIKAGAASAEAAPDAGKLIAIATDEVEINSSSKLGDFAIELMDGVDVPDATASLTLSASQADGRVITVAALTTGSVTVTGLAADTDLSKVAADATVTAKVVDNLDISGNDKLAGHVDAYNVIDGKVLTLSALQANDIEISATSDGDNLTAEGTVVIAGDVVAEDTNDNGIIDPDETIEVDLTKVELGFSFDDGSINVGTGVTLLLTAAQANGKVITGEGSVMVTGFDGTAIDLSKITVTGEKVVELDQDATLNTGAKLGSFTLDLDEYQLTVSSAQATSLDKIVDDEGTGTLIVHGTQTADSLDFSGKADWNFGSLTLDGSGAADYFKAPLGVDSIAFVGGNGADNYDVQGDQQVMIADFNMQVDELSIAKDGVAMISATGVANFADVEAGNRLDNKGILAIWGSDGADTITVSSGVNYLVGDEGDDTFIYTAARVDGDGPKAFDVIVGFGEEGDDDTIETDLTLTDAGGGSLGADQYKLISGMWDEEAGTFTESLTPDEMSTMLVFDADSTKVGVQQTSILLVGVDPNDVSYAGGVFSHSIA